MLNIIINIYIYISCRYWFIPSIKRDYRWNSGKLYSLSVFDYLKFSRNIFSFHCIKLLGQADTTLNVTMRGKMNYVRTVEAHKLAKTPR